MDAVNSVVARDEKRLTRTPARFRLCLFLIARTPVIRQLSRRLTRVPLLKESVKDVDSIVRSFLLRKVLVMDAVGPIIREFREALSWVVVLSKKVIVILCAGNESVYPIFALRKRDAEYRCPWLSAPSCQPRFTFTFCFFGFAFTDNEIGG